jgi:hypothetical protein
MRIVKFAKVQTMKSQMLVPGRRSGHVLFKSAPRAGLWRNGHFLKDPANQNPNGTMPETAAADAVIRHATGK